jgi:hypothetical protein
MFQSSFVPVAAQQAAARVISQTAALADTSIHRDRMSR